MNRNLSLAIGLAASALAVAVVSPPTGADPAPKSALDFTVKDIDGKDVKLSKYHGKVVMIVNTASHCGFTPQYKTLEALYEKYKDKGFIILGFPSNDFGQQEPGTNVEIKQFCTMNYKVSFDMFSKIDVKGDNKAPLYAFLTSKETDPQYPGDITWNFNKFLIDRKGNLVNRFDSKFDPMTPPVIGAVEAALAAPTTSATAAH
jgi:glutathione peroxidase